LIKAVILDLGDTLFVEETVGERCPCGTELQWNDKKLSLFFPYGVWRQLASQAFWNWIPKV